MTTFTTPWRPIFETPPALASVAGDCRLAIVQQQDFLERAKRMGANEREPAEIVEALQLCERTYGFKAVHGALPFVEGLMACAVMSLQVSLRRVAALCEQPSAGVLVGGWVEEEIGVDEQARRFPIGLIKQPPIGPSVTFGDCVNASRWMAALHILTPGHVDRLRAYAALACAIRTQQGVIRLEVVTRLAEQAAQGGDKAEETFTRAISEAHVAGGVMWDWYVRLVQKPARMQSWQLDVELPQEQP